MQVINRGTCNSCLYNRWRIETSIRRCFHGYRTARRLLFFNMDGRITSGLYHLSPTHFTICNFDMYLAFCFRYSLKLFAAVCILDM
jgi:hypothetical protein